MNTKTSRESGMFLFGEPATVLTPRWPAGDLLCLSSRPGELMSCSDLAPSFLRNIDVVFLNNLTNAQVLLRLKRQEKITYAGKMVTSGKAGGGSRLFFLDDF